MNPLTPPDEPFENDQVPLGSSESVTDDVTHSPGEAPARPLDPEQVPGVTAPTGEAIPAVADSLRWAAPDEPLPVLSDSAFEYLGADGLGYQEAGAAPSRTPEQRSRRRRRLAVVAGSVAGVLVLASVGAFAWVRSTPEYKLVSALQGTVGTDGYAVIRTLPTSSAASTDGTALPEGTTVRVGWTKDARTTALDVMQEGKGDWLQLVLSSSTLYVRSDAWSKSMTTDLPPLTTASEPSLQPALDALRGGNWLGVNGLLGQKGGTATPTATPSPSSTTPMGGFLDPYRAVLDDAVLRAQLERAQALLWDAVRTHTTIVANANDDRGDRYLLTFDTKAAVQQNLSAITDIATTVERRYWELNQDMYGQDLATVYPAPTPVVIPSSEVEKLRPISATVWVKDGRVSGLQFDPDQADSDVSKAGKVLLDMAFDYTTGPQVPTPAATLDATKAGALANDVAFGGLSTGTAASGSGSTPGGSAPVDLVDDQGRSWTMFGQQAVLVDMEDPNAESFATRQPDGTWKLGRSGKAIVLLPK